MGKCKLKPSEILSAIGLGKIKKIKKKNKEKLAIPSVAENVGELEISHTLQVGM